jgi:hypothetical protein
MFASSDLTVDSVTMSSRPAGVDESSVAAAQQLPSFTVQNLLNQSTAKTDHVAAVATPSSDMMAADAIDTPPLRSDVAIDGSARQLANIFGSNLTSFADRHSQQDQSTYGHQSLFYGYVADNGLTAASPAATSAASIDSAFYSPYADAAGASAEGGQSMITSPCDISGYLSCAPGYKQMAFPSSVPDIDATAAPLFRANVPDYVDSLNNSPEMASSSKYVTSSSGYVGGAASNSGNMPTSATGSGSAKPSFGGISNRSGHQLLRESPTSSTFLDSSSASVGHRLDGGLVGSYLQTREDLYFGSSMCYSSTVTNFGESEFDAAVVTQRPPTSAPDECGRSGGVLFPVSQSSSLHPGLDGCDRLPVKTEAASSADFNRRHDIAVSSAAIKKSPQWVSASSLGCAVSLQNTNGTHANDYRDAAADSVGKMSDAIESKGMSANRFDVCLLVDIEIPILTLK